MILFSLSKACPRARPATSSARFSFLDVSIRLGQPVPSLGSSRPAVAAVWIPGIAGFFLLSLLAFFESCRHEERGLWRLGNYPGPDRAEHRIPRAGRRPLRDGSNMGGVSSQVLRKKARFEQTASNRVHEATRGGVTLPCTF